MLRYLDDQKPLERYLEIKAEMKRLKEELDELQPLILTALWEEPEQRTAYRGYELAVNTRRSYQYSEAVQEMQTTLRDLKKAEEQDGTALLSRNTSFVVVRPIRKEEGY